MGEMLVFENFFSYLLLYSVDDTILGYEEWFQIS